VRNFDEFVGDARFKELDEKKKKIILEVDRIFEKEGYVFRGNWKNFRAYKGHNCVFELVLKIGKRKNLVTLKPLKDCVVAEIYWGNASDVPEGKSKRTYCSLRNEKDVSGEFIEVIRELYSYMKEHEIYYKLM